MSDWVVRVNQLSHRYGKRTALDAIDLSIPSNRMIGIVGPDGVGKSTLMSLIAGVRMLQTGTLEVLGGPIDDERHRRAVCPRIAYMPQGLGKNLYMTLSVFENVDFFGRLFGQDQAERHRRIDDLLSSTGLSPFKDRPAGKLSGGMKQKVGLCCALIHDPDLLILDEPTTGVDPLSRRQFWDLIRRIRVRRPTMCVLVSTAYMDEADGFDWIVAMDDGKVLATGTPAELKARVGADNLDAAFIRLLPEEKRAGHRDLVVPPRAAGEPESIAIEAEGLTRRFGDFTAVDHVSFKIARGEIFGFLGSNGCGKTTTMKMLTGLLPSTEGLARMFGHPVKPNDLETRKRVGFMSQAFSLYTELTVRQNLQLHAKLYHLSPEEIPQRIDEMVSQFHLDDYVDMLAESLPLGVRQRLSLAVSMIHRPELLILDEPTSGVDPVAREGFWELLIRLSREERVTIFVSTHFMNEAAWCDRISLMHAGRVLTSDVPSEIVRKSGAATLEQAFIHHLEKAAVERGESTAPAVDTPAEVSSPEERTSTARHGSSSFSWLRLFGYAYREALEIKRDPIRLTFALAGSAILMFVLGYGISMDVQDIAFATFDRDRSPESRAYLERVSGSRYFIEKAPIETDEEMETRLRSGQLGLVLEIPSGFGKDIQRKQPAEVGAWVDGTNASRAETISSYLQGLHNEALLDYVPSGTPPSKDPIIESRYRYNQDYKSINSMAPATIPLLLVMIPAMLMALGVVREKELGSIANFYATPVTRLEFVLGKQLPYVALGMINFLGLVAITVFFFGVPVKGSFLALMVGGLLYVITTTGLGLVMSAFTRTQIAAVFGTAIATILPASQLSGLTTPVSSLEGGAAFVGKLYPTTYFMTISRGAFTKALGFEDLGGSFLALVIFIPVLTTLAVLLLKKQEA